jgi:hypothetical protein
MRKHLPRWIFASISKHFDTHRSGIEMYVEGQDRKTDVDDFFELRMDGPYYRELSKNFFEVRFEINVLIQSELNDNYHRIHEIIGIVSDAFFTPINIYRFGSEQEDDGSFFDCVSLSFEKRRRDALEIHQFGKIEPSTKIMQATVEGHYELNVQF